MRHWRPSAKVNEHTDTGRGERAERLACMDLLLSLEIRFGFVEPESARTKLRAAATTTGTTKEKASQGARRTSLPGQYTTADPDVRRTLCVSSASRVLSRL